MPSDLAESAAACGRSTLSRSIRTPRLRPVLVPLRRIVPKAEALRIQRSRGVSPVRLAILASIRGQISSRSWDANTNRVHRLAPRPGEVQQQFSRAEITDGLWASRRTFGGASAAASGAVVSGCEPRSGGCGQSLASAPRPISTGGSPPCFSLRDTARAHVALLHRPWHAACRALGRTRQALPPGRWR